MVFPVVMYVCESWTVKKAEHRRIDAFEMWCWRRLLIVPWTVRRSNQSILKEISPEYSLEGLMLKLKLQHFGHLMQRTDSFEDPDAPKDWGGRRRGDREWDCWHHRLHEHEFGSSCCTGRSGVLQSMESQRSRHDRVSELREIYLINGELGDLG